MIRKSSIPLADSLKGKIWLSSVALAFFVCTFGSLSYVVVSFLISDPFYAVFIPFLFLAMLIVAFGLWLASEVSAPVEKLSLIAKSLERGISTSLPKSSGSKETDELLDTIQRIGGQVQRLVSSMENVAQGNLDAVYAQNSNSDRISVAFQKLLTKVSESIHAKQELEKLQLEVNRLSEKAEFIRKENFSIKVETGDESTKEIALTINFLSEQLNDLASRIKETTAKTQPPAAQMKKDLTSMTLHDASRIQEITQTVSTLKNFPALLTKISGEISQSTAATSQEIEKIRENVLNSQEAFNRVGKLRRQLQESVQRVQKLREFAQEIESAARTVGDLAQRANLVALNSSIQSAEIGEHGKSFIVVSEEIQRLATRTEKTHKHIDALNKSVKSEIEKIEESLKSIGGEAANFSRFTIETSNVTSDIERYLSRYLKLQEKCDAYANEKSGEITQTFAVLDNFVSESSVFSKELQNSVQTAQEILQYVEAAQYIVADFNALPPPATESSKEKSQIIASSNVSNENLEGETYNA